MWSIQMFTVCAVISAGILKGGGAAVQDKAGFEWENCIDLTSGRTQLNTLLSTHFLLFA
jgi:hypothetical protein